MDIDGNELLTQISVLRFILGQNIHFFQPHDMDLPDYSTDIINSIILNYVIEYIQTKCNIK
jgi:hypothetical protein